MTREAIGDESESRNSERSAAEKIKEAGTVAKEFITDKAQKLYEKLEPAAKELVGDLYERADRNIVGRSRVWFNDKIAGFYERRAEKHASDAASSTAQIEKRRSLIEGQAEQRKGYLERFPESIAKFDSILARERRTLEARITQFEGQREKAQMHADSWGGRQSVYEKKRNEIIGDYTGSIEERLTPYQEKFSRLQSEKHGLDEKINDQEQKIEWLRGGIKEIERQLADPLYKSDYRGLKEKRRELRKIIFEHQKEMKGPRKDRHKIEKKLTHVGSKIGVWEYKRHRFERYKRGEVAEGEDTAKSSVIGGARIRQEPRIILKERIREDSAHRVPGNYADAWNEFEGSFFIVDVDDFARFAQEGEEEAMPVDKLEEIFKKYLLGLKEKGRMDHVPDIFWRRLDDNISSLRSNL